MGALNKIFSGDSIVWENGTGGDVANKGVVAIGTKTVGVASEAIADGATGTLDITGIFSLPALSTGVWDTGDSLWYDTDNDELTDIAASGHLFFGFAHNEKTNGTTTAEAVLRPFAEEGSRSIALAALKTLSATDFTSGRLNVFTTTTGGTFAITVPSAATSPVGAELYVHNVAGTNAATLTGGITLATIDAVGDRVLYTNTGTAWVQSIAVIA